MNHLHCNIFDSELIFWKGEGPNLFLHRFQMTNSLRTFLPNDKRTMNIRLLVSRIIIRWIIASLLTHKIVIAYISAEIYKVLLLSSRNNWARTIPLVLQPTEISQNVLSVYFVGEQ